MDTSITGRVTTEATVHNLQDLWDAERGLCPRDAVRWVELTEALVDTGATTLCLPIGLIRKLGLNKSYEKLAISSRGLGPVNVYQAVQLTIMGRSCTVDVMEVHDDVPPLIGQITLEMLDLVVDPQGRRLIGNPAHGGQHVLELY